MKKHYFALLTAFLLTFYLCSCNKSENTVSTDSSSSVSETKMPETEAVSTGSEKIIHENDESRKIKEYYVSDTNFDTSVLNGVADVKSNGTDIWSIIFSDQKVSVCHMDVSGKLIRNDEISMNAEKRFINSFIAADGLYYFSFKSNNSGKVQTYFGYVKPDEGIVTISDDFKYDFIDFAADSEKIYLHSRQNDTGKEKITTLDRTGNVLSEEKLFEGHDKLAGDGLFEHDGQICLLYRDYSENTGNPDKKMIPLSNLSELEKSIKVDLPPDEKYLPCSLKDYDLYFFGNTRVFGVKINGDKTEIKKINELLMSDTMEFRFSESTGTIVPINADQVFHIGFLDGPSESSVHALKKADEKYLEELNTRSIVTLGADLEGKGAYKISDIYEKIRIFNSTQDDSFVVLKDMAFKQQSFETRITEDVVSGTNPDVIIYNMNITDLRKLASQNKFADLKEIMKDDEEIKFEDINPSVSELCMLDNKMFMIFPEYDLEVLSTRNSACSEKELTSEDFLKICSEEKGSAINGMFPETITDSMISAYLKDHVDFSGKKCDFENDDFKNLLSSLYEMRKNNIFSKDDHSLAEKSFSELASSVFSDFAASSEKYALSMNRYESPFISAEFEAQTGEKMHLVNYPSSKVKQLVEPHFTISVFETCPDKASAWRFIRNYLSDSYQKTLRYPVMKNAIENYVSMMSDTKSKDNYVFDSYHCKDEKEAKEASELYSEIIYSPAAINYNYSLSSSFKQRTNLMNIIMEQTEKYYNDTQSLTDTVSSIQNRVEEYLNS